MAKARKHASSTPALEWLAAALGLAMILFVAAVIGREAMAVEQTQLPAIKVNVLAVTPGPTGFVVAFEAVNQTSGTAAAVAIEGKSGEETSTATLDYVAGNASAKGGLFFKQDPRGAPLELRAMGFQTP